MRNCILLLALMVPLSAAAGGVSKCVRANGAVIYTDKVCPTGTSPDRITAPMTSYSGQGAQNTSRAAAPAPAAAGGSVHGKMVNRARRAADTAASR